MIPGRLIDSLDQMLEAAGLACSYVEGMSREAFFADKRTQQAVIMNLLLIGEAATLLLRDHADVVGAHADVPWRNMKGMRNRIAHSYFDINLEVVWETVRSALPDLISHLPAIRDGIAGNEPMAPGEG